MSLNNFLSAFYPSETENIWLLGFSPKDMPEEIKRHPYKRCTTRKELSDNKVLQGELKQINEEQGLYFCVNAGGTEKKDIQRINAVFCEKDDTSIEQQHDLFDNCPLPPSIRVETKKSVHAYWLLNEVITIPSFSKIQNGLIEYFLADNHIKNENRVMRLPYFHHVSFSEGELMYKRINIHTFNSDIKFSLKELTETFPYTPPPMPVYSPNRASDDWQKVFTDLRFRISQLPTYKIERNRQWATAKGVCHNGKNNSALQVNLISGAVVCKSGCGFEHILHAFGLAKPQKVEVQFVKRKEQFSNTYKWLKKYQTQKEAAK